MKLFLDTNVLLRFYLRDVEEQFTHTTQLIAAIEEGTHRPYTSSIVLLEIAYVLQRLYKMPKKEVAHVLQSIHRLRGLTILEKTNSSAALELFKKHAVKYADCLIASQLKKGITLVTYDKDFKKLGIQSREPREVITASA